MIYVEDDGEGIDAEDKPKLFKLFGKLKSAEGVNN
jgi:signal transduction histidine kinase